MADAYSSGKPVSQWTVAEIIANRSRLSAEDYQKLLKQAEEREKGNKEVVDEDEQERQVEQRLRDAGLLPYMQRIGKQSIAGLTYEDVAKMEKLKSQDDARKKLAKKQRQKHREEAEMTPEQLKEQFKQDSQKIAKRMAEKGWDRPL